MEELQGPFLREQLRNPIDLNESQVDSIPVQTLMRPEAEAFLYPPAIDTLWREHLQAMDACVNRLRVPACGYGQKRSPDRIQERGLRHVPRHDDFRCAQWIYSIVHVPAPRKQGARPVGPPRPEAEPPAAPPAQLLVCFGGGDHWQQFLREGTG